MTGRGRTGVLARVAAIDLAGSEGVQPVGYALAGPLAAVVGARRVARGWDHGPFG